MFHFLLSLQIRKVIVFSIKTFYIFSVCIFSLHNSANEVRKSVSLSGPIGGGTPIPVKNSDFRSSSKKEPAKTEDQHSKQVNSSSVTPVEMNSTDQRDTTGPQQSQSFMSKFFGSKNEEETGGLTNIVTNSGLPLTSVEDFVPDDGMLDKSFLDDGKDADKSNSQNDQIESDRYFNLKYFLWFN